MALVRVACPCEWPVAVAAVSACGLRCGAGKRTSGRLGFDRWCGWYESVRRRHSDSAESHNCDAGHRRSPRRVCSPATQTLPAWALAGTSVGVWTGLQGSSGVLAPPRRPAALSMPLASRNRKTEASAGVCTAQTCREASASLVRPRWPSERGRHSWVYQA
jgi:hypothetical protein